MAKYFESPLIYEFKQWFSVIHEEFDSRNWNAVLIISELKDKKYNIDDFVKLLPTHKPNLDQVSLYNSLGKLGFQVNFESFKANLIDSRIFPSIYKRGENIYVVTDSQINASNVVLTAINTDTKKYEEVLCELSEEIGLIVIKEDVDVNATSFLDEHKELGISWFKPIIERFDPLFYQIFFSTLILGLFSVLSPLFIMYSFSLVSDGSHDNLFLMSVGAIASVCIELAIRNIRSKSINWISSRIGHIIGLKLFEKLLWLPSHYIETASTSAQISKLKTFDSIRDFFQGPIFKTVLDVPISIVAFIALCFIGKSLALIPLLTIGFYFGISFFVNYKMWLLTKESLRSQALKQNLSLETFEKRFSLRTSGVSEKFIERNRHISGESCHARFKLSFLSSFTETLIHTITTVSVATTLFWGIHMVWSGDLNPVAIIIATILLSKIIQPYQVMATSLPKIQQFYSIVKQLNKLMDIKTEYNEEYRKKRKVENLKGEIIFNRVGVKFSRDSDPIFTSLNFKIKPGEAVSITGLNGSGKSTLLKLIEGMYRPQVGSISIDGYDIRQASATELRRNIAYLPQTPQFFQGSIIENIRMGNPLASHGQVNYILEELQLMDEIKNIKGGLNAQVNSELLNKIQSTLMYKLALARTLISNSNIVLLDELPFSILSGPIGERVYQFIEDWIGHRTTIFVTNSEDFIKLSNKSIYLQHNKTPLIAKPEFILKEVNREKMAA